MIRSTASKVMWVGRATVFLVGLAVILALLFGVATTALAHSKVDNKLFHLGHFNSASTPTSLVSTLANAAKSAMIVNNKSGGPALDLRVGNATTPANDVAPMKVNSKKVVTNLNADKLDGEDASAFASSTHDHDAAYVNETDHTKAAHDTLDIDADTLDGQDSTDFASSAVESWHEVGQTGEPAFQNEWQNLGDSRTATAAFYKDPWGVVHLKGTVKSGTNGLTIFTLPCGYGPDKDQNFAVVSYGANTSNAGILDVAFLTPPCGDGSYRAEVRAAQSSATAFSLNDVTFRAHGS